VLRLTVFAPPGRADSVCDSLAALPGIRHIGAAGTTTEGLVTVSAEVGAASADAAIDVLADLGLDSNDVILRRVAGIRPLSPGLLPI
jgi:hypothetical protein